MVGVGSVVVWTAACASAPTKIPSASASPSASPTIIAPGVSATLAQLTLPPYSVSTANPLTDGVSAKAVVANFVTDNFIENQALEREDAQLLAYSDAGGMLALDEATITSNRTSGSRILSIEDSISSLVLGREVDPNDPSAQAMVNVEGVERTMTRDAQGHILRTVDDFHVLIWMTWSTTLQKYLRCDLSVL